MLREFPGKLYFINPPYRKLGGKKKVGEKRRDTARQLWIQFFCFSTYATLFMKIIFVAECQERNLMVANCDTALRLTQFIFYLYARWFRYAKFCQYDFSSTVVPGQKNILTFPAIWQFYSNVIEHARSLAIFFLYSFYFYFFCINRRTSRYSKIRRWKFRMPGKITRTENIWHAWHTERIKNDGTRNL